MHRHLPTAAILLGLAGLIPFIACGVAAVSAVAPAAPDQAIFALIAYGAVILAFLGGVHWGFVLDTAVDAPAAPPPRRETTRLLLGVVPSLIGWLALLATVLAGPAAGLALLIAGFLATIIGEWRLHQRGLVPIGYMWLRWGLSIVVLATLITVLTLRLAGAKIVF